MQERAMISRRLACLLLALAPLRGVGLSASAWKADLDYLAQELPKRNKNLFSKLPREEFEREVARIAEALPDMPDVEVRIALVRLVASAANAHTRIDGARGKTSYPIRFRQFADGLYVTAAKPEFA